MNQLHRGFEGKPIFLSDQMRINPFRQAIWNEIDGQLGSCVDAFIRETRSEMINRLNRRRHFSPRRVHDKVGMAHLALALPLADLARNYALFANGELPLQPTAVGAKIGEG